MVHARYAPCPRNGEPASAAPIHVDEVPSRVDAIENARQRVGGQRPIVAHIGSWADARDHELGVDGGQTCWCKPICVASG